MTTTFDHGNSWTERELKTAHKIETMLSGLKIIEVKNILALILTELNETSYCPALSSVEEAFLRVNEQLKCERFASKVLPAKPDDNSSARYGNGA